MGSGEGDKSSKEKEAKELITSNSQEQTPAASGTVAADWSTFQAYSPVPPHGYLASSPQTHPYMWGVQQFMPPYGTPPHPYVAMYPHGGIYAHPTMAPGSYPFSPFAIPSPNGLAEAHGNSPNNIGVDGKSTEGKEKLPIKRSKGNSGSFNTLTAKNSESGKTSGPSSNGVYSKSAESVDEVSSDGSDDNSQSDSQLKSNNHQDSAEPSQNGSAVHSSQNGGLNTPHSMVNQILPIAQLPAAGTVGGVPGPTTNLHIGMDYWCGTPSSGMPAMGGKLSSSPVSGGIVATGSQEAVQSQHWIQDERELKRQRRKQSNRESARRSRLRKQAECDELAQRAEGLKEENASLRAELARIRNDYEQLVTQNASLKERLGEPAGQEDPQCGQDELQ